MIRPLKPSDIAFIQSHPGQMLGSGDTKETIEKATIRRKDAQYFIFEEGVPKGYIGCHHHREYAEIVTLYVPEIYRQQNVATQLLEYVMDWAQTQAIKKITLEVSENNHPAIKLYQKQGFKKIHQRLAYYQDHANAWVMIKEFA